MKTEAQKRAEQKYRKKVKQIVLHYYPKEEDDYLKAKELGSARIKEIAKEQTGWHPYPQERPKDTYDDIDRFYLCTIKTHGQIWEAIIRWETCHWYILENDIIAWMELPRPYDEEISMTHMRTQMKKLGVEYDKGSSQKEDT